MPALITHYLFGLDMYRGIDNVDIKRTIKNNKCAYCLGLQGPDIFFYDLSLVFGPDEKNIGSLMHEHKTNLFFYNYITNLLSLPSHEFSIGLSYLCGLLGHYCLDVHLHPYIYYRAGFSITEKDSNRTTLPEHANIESILDKILLKQKQNILPSKFKQSTTFCMSKTQIDLLGNIMTRSINETFSPDQNNIASRNSFKKAVVCAKLGTRFLHDSTGIKQKLIRHLEQVFSIDPIVSSLIVTDHLTDNMDICNNKHLQWENPWNVTITSSESIEELYKNAEIHFQKIVPYLYPLNKDSIAPILSLIGNRSYHSGLPLVQKNTSYK